MKNVLINICKEGWFAVSIIAYASIPFMFYNESYSIIPPIVIVSLGILGGVLNRSVEIGE
jgi:hypothetical protein